MRRFHCQLNSALRQPSPAPPANRLVHTSNNAGDWPTKAVSNNNECHQALSKVLGKLERRLVLQIIDAKDRIAEETSIDSFIAGFELAWKLSVELNHYENERSVSCQTAMGSGARFASKEEEK